jgi:maleylpyruvate isomerase
MDQLGYDATVARDIAGAAAAHRRLIEAIDGLADADVAAASLLPGWTVGHVLTHIARNADSHVRMIEGAEAGGVADQYDGGESTRSADIERGAGRNAAEVVADVVASAERLERSWSTAGTAWTGEGRTLGGLAPIADLPFRRWRETELHHFDLGRGYGMDQWPAEYVRLELGVITMQWSSRRPMGLTALPPQALAADERTRLAWLVGRTDIDGLAPAGILR